MNATQLRHMRRRERQKAKKKKETRISPYSMGIFDPTPHNAVHLIRGEIDRVIYKYHRPHYPHWHYKFWEDDDNIKGEGDD